MHRVRSLGEFLRAKDHAANRLVGGRPVACGAVVVPWLILLLIVVAIVCRICHGGSNPSAGSLAPLAAWDDARQSTGRSWFVTD
jgi:hypothetical protein